MTPLGMLEGYATIASGGTVMRPRIVTRIVRMDGKVEEKPKEVEVPAEKRLRNIEQPDEDEYGSAKSAHW